VKKKEDQEEPLEAEEEQEELTEGAEEPETEEEPEETSEAEEKQASEEKTEETESKEEEMPPPSEKEEEEAEQPAREKKAEEEEEIVEERIYTVPLGKALIMPPRKRTPRAMRMLRSFMVKHMKLEARKPAEGEEEEEPKNLIISSEVNEKLWERGVEKPPRKIRVRAAKDKEGNVTVYLAEGD